MEANRGLRRAGTLADVGRRDRGPAFSDGVIVVVCNRSHWRNHLGALLLRVPSFIRGGRYAKWFPPGPAHRCTTGVPTTAAGTAPAAFIVRRNAVSSQ